MLPNSNITNRYSDKDLEEFKEHIEQKLESSILQLNSMQDRIENISETSGNDGDWMDDSSNAQDIDMLNAMIGRQRKHIRDLENAMIRVHNKHYGICVLTGELIDKRRLMAVPTTTKSLAAKTAIGGKPQREETERKKPKSATKPNSFSRVIKRAGGTSKPVAKQQIDEDEDEDDLNFDEGYNETNNIDLDMIVDESSIED